MAIPDLAIPVCAEGVTTRQDGGYGTGRHVDGPHAA
jgi:hypothetical protein